MKFLLTGNRFNQKNTNQYDLFLNYVKKNSLQGYFKYLGFVSHEKVINLIYNAKFLINPSFYEGWSTTVEEGKIFNKHMILSNISVHLEQGANKAIYFNPNNYLELSKKLIKLNRKKNKSINIIKLKKNYEKLRNDFLKNYLKILSYND